MVGEDDDEASTSSSYSDAEATSTETTESQTIGKEEDKAVGFSRVLVCGVLLCAVVGAGILTFTSTRRVEERAFETEVSRHRAHLAITADDFYLTVTSFSSQQ